MPKVIKSQVIELIQPANGTATKIQFADQPYLRGKQILGIETFNDADDQTSPTNKPVFSAGDQQKCYLTLYLNDIGQPQNVGEWIQLVPFVSLHRVQNNSSDAFVRQLFELQGQVIYWEKCYVTASSSLGNTVDTSFLFQIFFRG